MKKVGIALLFFIVLSTPANISDTVVPLQVQTDWSPSVGERLHCLNTVMWASQEGNLHSETWMNGWSLLSMNDYPEVDGIDVWDDIPHPNITFSKEEFSFMGTCVFEDIYSSRNVFQGQDQFWFNYVLPNRNVAFFQSLLETLTVGPWNHSINPEYFNDSSFSPTYWGYQYTFTHEDYTYNVSVTYWTAAGYASDEHYFGVIRDGWIKMYDTSSGEEVHMRRMRCSPAGPTIVSQSFYHAGEMIGQADTGEYTERESENLIQWSPLFVPTGFTASYSLLCNGSVVLPEQTHATSNTYGLLESTSLNYSVDGLSPGVYNFTLILKDSTHATHVSTFWLKVYPYTYTTEAVILVTSIVLICLGIYLFRSRRN